MNDFFRKYSNTVVDYIRQCSPLHIKSSFYEPFFNSYNTKLGDFEMEHINNTLRYAIVVQLFGNYTKLQEYLHYTQTSLKTFELAPSFVYQPNVLPPRKSNRSHHPRFMLPLQKHIKLPIHDLYIMYHKDQIDRS